MATQSNRRNFLKAGTAAGTAILLSQMPHSAAIAGEEQNEADCFFKVIKTRRSIRKYLPTLVPEEHLTQILEAARMAPTAGNQQPWKFLVVRDQQKINELKTECINLALDGFKARKANPTEKELNEFNEKVAKSMGNYLSAPVFIIVLTDSKSIYPTYNDQDGPLAAGYLMLAARALGYGTVYITDAIPDVATQKVFNIPENYKRVCITPVGVPENWPEPPVKKDLKELVVYEKFD